MSDASNDAAPQQHGLIFAKQCKARNDILRKEVCHFWTVHSAFIHVDELCDVITLIALRLLSVIASEAKQSIYPLCCAMDFFASLAMTPSCIRGSSS